MDLHDIVEAPLVVVTNREPYVDEKTSKGIRTVQKVGGLVSALDPILQRVGGDWIAWGSGSADKLTAPDGQRMVPPKNPRYRLNRVFLSKDEIEGYYEEYANQGLWPLSHMLIERAQFSEHSWAMYQFVNGKFARAAAENSPDNAWVFSHDYHLALFPTLLRKLRSDVAIAHFWHIPWPPLTIFKLCPQYQEILRGMLGADILGFQTAEDVDNFLSAVVRTVKSAVIDWKEGTIHWHNRVIRVQSFPISVDIEAIEKIVLSPRIHRWQNGLRRRLARYNRVLGISVDRADYTKGIIPRLKAIKEFFERYPEHLGQVTFLQIVVPTRSEVEEYRALYADVVQKSKEINDQFETSDWTPVITVRRPIDRPRLMGLFRAADFALVNSLFDGMNLVAKEFVSSQVDSHGILLLSESAGASEELKHSFPINPLNREGFAKTLHEALSISDAERIERMTLMRKYLYQNTIYDWIKAILISLEEVSQPYVKP